ncbi:MAG: hypothetical protein HC902_03200 [Calothrix sp. SM1_5_4]|nr:hypothetical protein [Calothrix sp. SM1_5_4]
MFPKNWKWLVLAPLMVSVLAACQKDRDHDTEDPSPFTGLWVKDEAIGAFERSRGSTAFCDEACGERSAPLHGLSANPENWDGVARVQAWVVTSKGEVFEWIATGRLDNPSYRERHYVGHLRNDGFFLHQRQQRARPFNYYGSYSANNNWTTEANFSLINREQAMLIVPMSHNNGAAGVYRRITQKELLEYSNAIMQ